MDHPRLSMAALVGVATLVLGLLHVPAMGQAVPSVTGGASSAMAKLPDSWVTIHIDLNWLDENGERILTRSGCLCMFKGVWYWYGGNQRGFREQYVYTSTDLVKRTNKGIVLRHDTDANRIDVLYNDRTRQYVMFLKYDGNGAYFAIATSDRPDGQFPMTTARYVRMYATQRAPLAMMRRGRPTTGPATQPAPGGYSLFDLMVLKDADQREARQEKR